MSNLTSTSTGTYSVTSNSLGIASGGCGAQYDSSVLHMCPSSGGPAYNYPTYPTYPGYVFPSTTTSTGTGWFPIVTFSYYFLKTVKEITTDMALSYEWSGTSYDMKLPAKFSDAFLKIGSTWLPLYPLIFSAFENDETTISFHLVISIMDKTFEGNDVVLKGVTTIKIEDNLNLLQLTARTKDYFKDDKTNTPLHE
jgi:hypothetical protein